MLLMLMMMMDNELSAHCNSFPSPVGRRLGSSREVKVRAMQVRMKLLETSLNRTTFRATSITRNVTIFISLLPCHRAHLNMQLLSQSLSNMWALPCYVPEMHQRGESNTIIYSIGSYLYGPPLSDCAERFAAMYKQSRVAAEQDRFIRNLLQPSNHHITRSIYSHDGPRKRQTQLDGFPLQTASLSLFALLFSSKTLLIGFLEESRLAMGNYNYHKPTSGPVEIADIFIMN